MELSNDVPDEALQQRLSNIAPNKTCSLIYTVSWSLYFFFLLLLNVRDTENLSVSPETCVALFYHFLMYGMWSNPSSPRHCPGFWQFYIITTLYLRKVNLIRVTLVYSATQSLVKVLVNTAMYLFVKGICKFCGNTMADSYSAILLLQSFCPLAHNVCGIFRPLPFEFISGYIFNESFKTSPILICELFFHK
jgi:hypothetical protein